jgi:AAA domain
MSKKKPFELEVHKPYSTFTAGKPTPIPFLIDGLLPYSAFSILGGKAKHGKSSMSRIEAVAVAKGQPFLERNTERAEVLLCSLEDPRQHVDNCFDVLGWNPESDATIHVVTKLAPDLNTTVAHLEKFLTYHPAVKFVVLDTLAKSIRVNDSNNYDEMLPLCEKLHVLARESGVHIQALAHCKKIQTEDPFDGFLGSVEVRGEPDTNIILFDRNGKRLLQSETRMGTAWEATEIRAEMAQVGSTSVVKRFYLGTSLASTNADSERTKEVSTKFVIKSRLLASLTSNGGKMRHEELIDGVTGNRQTKRECLDALVKDKKVRLEGIARSSRFPLTAIIIEKDESETPKSPETPKPEFFFCKRVDSGCMNHVPIRGLCDSCKSRGL